MLIDGIKLLGSSVAENFTISSGAAFPTDTNTIGELFYLTAGETGLYVYDGSQWQAGGGDSLPAQVGQGGKFLTTDGSVVSWASPSVTSLNATATINPASTITVNAIQAGLGSDTVPRLWLINGGANVNQRAWAIQNSSSTGVFEIKAYADDLGSSTAAFRINRSNNVASNIFLTGTAITLTGDVTFSGSLTGAGTALTALNASNLGSGTVPVARLGSSGTASASTYLRGDNSWAAAPTPLTIGATGVSPISTSVSGIYGGLRAGGGTVPTLSFTNSGAAAGNRTWEIQGGNGNASAINFRALNDANDTATDWLVATRNLQVVTNITLTATAITLTGAVTGTSFSGTGTALTALNASNLGSGTVPIARLGASGTASSTTFLRGDNSWVAIPVSVTLDAANTFTKAQTVAQVTLTDGTTITPDASLSNNFRVVLAGNRALANPTNLVAGQIINFIIVQDTTGTRTLTYGTMFKWPGATPPTLSTAANAVDVLSCYYDGTNLLCSMNKNFA